MAAYLSDTHTYFLFRTKVKAGAILENISAIDKEKNEELEYHLYRKSPIHDIFVTGHSLYKLQNPKTLVPFSNNDNLCIPWKNSVPFNILYEKNRNPNILIFDNKNCATNFVCD